MYADTTNVTARLPKTVRWDEPPSEFLDLGHSQLAYRRIGEGPDLVFVHGWPVHMATWRPAVEVLSEHFTCHLLDLPGAGYTRCQDRSKIALGAHVETMRTAIDQLGLERFALIAHDSGAAIARHLAVGDERVAALVMGNTEIPGHMPVLLAMLVAFSKLPGGGAMFAALLRSRRLRRSVVGFGAAFADPSYVDGRFHDEVIGPMVNEPRKMQNAMDLLVNLDHAFMAQLKRVHHDIKAPVHLIWGADDPYFPLDKARDMVGQFGGGATLEVLDPGRTFAHEERGGDFAASALPFLQKHLT